MNIDEIVHNLIIQTLGQQQLAIIQLNAQLQALKVGRSDPTKKEARPESVNE